MSDIDDQIRETISTGLSRIKEMLDFNSIEAEEVKELSLATKAFTEAYTEYQREV